STHTGKPFEKQQPVRLPPIITPVIYDLRD
ncbi:unnamed protein product, partial [marine sediment metagenome]